MQNLNSIIENNVKAAKESVSQFKCKSEEIQKRLSNLNQTASRHKLTVTSGLHECRETLVNFTNSGSIDLSPGESTPARMQFDPSSLAQPSPKERVLSRFRDQHPEQSLDGSIEFDRTIPSPPTEDQNILQPNVVHVESQVKNSLKKKSPKCDKENVPGLSWDTP